MRPETLDGCRRLAWYRRLLREEEGIALIFAIVSLVVLTAVLTAVIFLTAAGAREAQRSNAGQRAYSLAESGLNNALAILNANYPGTVGYPGDDKLLSTTLTTAVTLPAATISVANTTDFNPAPGTNTIALRSAGAISGPITCTGISATSFTGCTGGAAGPYPVGATVGRAAAYAPGFSQWSGTLDNSPPGLGWFDQWNITATGSVVNPTGPTAAAVTRTIRAVVPVIKPPDTEIHQNNPLNFIYGDTINFQQSVTVASPVYAIHDLRLQNSSVISEWIGNAAGKFNKIGVGRNFYEEQNANRAGHINGTADPANDLAQMYVVGQCSTKANTLTLHACAWGSTDHIWVDQSSSTNYGNVIPPDFIDYIPKLTCCSPYTFHGTLDPFEAARSSMGEAYRTADLGPLSPCTGGTSLPSSVFPNGFDTASGIADLDLNNSATPAASAAVDLTPNGVQYACKSRAGQLLWNGTNTPWPAQGLGPEQLRVQGTIFIDGSATISSSHTNQATVTGQGTLILTGTFMMKNALMCVKIDSSTSGNNTHCDTSTGAWDPNIGALIIVADGDGGYDATQGQSNNVIAGQGINIKSSDFQGGLIANKDVNVDTTSQMQGPMLSVYHTVNAGQSNVLTFPPLLFAPSGSQLLGPEPPPVLLQPQQIGGG